MLDTTFRVREKVDANKSDSESHLFNHQEMIFLKGWLDRVDLTMKELAEWIPEGEQVILVDGDELRPVGTNGVSAIPFLEKEGYYCGPPPDDETAISECERLRLKGAKFIAFAWPAFWWLDHYKAFHQYLLQQYRQVAETENIIVFDLQKS